MYSKLANGYFGHEVYTYAFTDEENPQGGGGTESQNPTDGEDDEVRRRACVWLFLGIILTES